MLSPLLVAAPSGSSEEALADEASFAATLSDHVLPSR